MIRPIVERPGQVTSEDLTKRFIKETALAGDIAALSEPVIEDLGYHLVRVIVSGRDGMTVQIMADKKGESETKFGIEAKFGIEDCEAISKELSPFLDSHDPIPGEYHLEVSSPGIDRPLVRPQDFIKWHGYEAKLEVKQAIDGRKRFKGLLRGYEDNEVLLEIANEDGPEPLTIGLNKALITSAKLVMNDDLLNSVAK